MKIGLHMGYWWGTDIGSDIKAIIAYTAQTGVDYLEINPRYFLHATSQERKDMRSYAQDLGLGILINGGAGEEADLASDSLASRKAGVAFWHKMLKAAQDLAAPVWSGLYTQPGCGILSGRIRRVRRSGSVQGNTALQACGSWAIFLTIMISLSAWKL